MLTRDQVRWAASHDWFVADNGDGTIEVLDRYVERDGSYHEDRLVWRHGFRALRDWAGY